MNEPVLNTVGKIAADLHVPLHRVTHILKSRDISPAARAGRFRLYDRAAVQRIAVELRLQDANRKGASNE